MKRDAHQRQRRHSIVTRCWMEQMKTFGLAFMSSMMMSSAPPLPPPIVYTIAGSDSGGGAGIQADLHAIHSMKCHGCSAITCLTAQNSCGVTDVHAPPASFLTTQLQTLLEDMPPRAIKIGMLGTKELAETVADFLKNVTSTITPKPWVVLDPVMISTSGHKLINDEATQAMITCVFPYTDVLTPNKYEAEALLQRKLKTPEDVKQGARDLLKMGVKSVLIKGGHSLAEGNDAVDSSSAADVNGTLGYAQDYFVSSIPRSDGEERLCDGARGVWLCSTRYVGSISLSLSDCSWLVFIGSSLMSLITATTRIIHMERDALCPRQSHPLWPLGINGVRLSKLMNHMPRVPRVRYIQSMRVVWPKPMSRQGFHTDKE